MLIHLIADLTRDSQLVERFADDPQAIFAEYNVPADMLELLRSRDVIKIAVKVGEEIQKLAAGPGKLDEVGVYWPGPPRPKSISPGSATIGKRTQVEVKGEVFLEHSRLIFQPNWLPIDEVEAEEVQVAEDGMSLKAKVTFGDGQKGVYDVVVLAPSGLAGTLEKAFTVMED